MVQPPLLTVKVSMAAVRVDQLVTLNQLRPMSPRLTYYLPCPRGNLMGKCRKNASQTLKGNSVMGYLTDLFADGGDEQLLLE